MARATINMRLFEGRAAASPGRYLGDLFGAYLGACRAAGGKYNPDGKFYAFEIAGLPAIKSALEAAGFDVVLDGALANGLAARADVARYDLDCAQQRIEALAARGLALFPHQRVGIEYLTARNKGCLFDEMGTGKSIVVLMSIPDGAPTLVICPAIAKGVWRRETTRWRPDLKPLVLEGRGSFRYPQPGEVVITNYDLLPADPAKLPPPAEGTVVVADEAHNLKNHKALRTSRFRAIAEALRVKDGRSWILTGTPVMGRPPELWGILGAADMQNDTFSSWKNFKELFNAYEDEYGLRWGTPTPAAVAALKRTTLRRTRAEVLPDLPAKIYREVEVTTDGATRRLCTALERALTQGGKVPLDQAIKMALRGQLPDMIGEISKARAALAAAKVPQLLEMIEEYEEQDVPLVVFSAHRAPVDALASRPGWAAISGDVSASGRTSVEEAFQAGRLKGVAGTIAASGVAITLTRAYNAIFVDRDWTPALNEQAEDRLARIGQTRGVIITDLVADNQIDEHLAGILGGKRTLIRATVSATDRKAGEGLGDLAAQLEGLLETANVRDDA